MEILISRIKRGISGRMRRKLVIERVWVVKKWKQNTSSQYYKACVYWLFRELMGPQNKTKKSAYVFFTAMQDKF